VARVLLHLSQSVLRHRIGFFGEQYYRFAKSPVAVKVGEVQDVKEYTVKGEVRKMFLWGGYDSYTLDVAMNDTDIQQIKRIVATVPSFEANGHRWPFTGDVARFSCKPSKDEAADNFDKVWDGRNIDVHNVDARVQLKFDEIQEGAMVFVEYSIVPYLGGKRVLGTIKNLAPG
jgi:hypothetical protein